MKRIILSDELAGALVDKGLVPPNTRRIVIDIKAGAPAVLHYELLSDEAVLEVFRDAAVKVVQG